MTLNPLSNPKGVNLVCELCQKPAFIQCTKCRVTYYCGIEHQKVDWVGIHEKICQLLIPLRTTLPFLSSSEERQHRTEQLLLRQKHMLDLTRTTGQKLLFEGRHEQAVPAAMQSLRFAIDVHGLASIELVPSYLILGEASIGLARLTQAEEYLAQAQWTVLKTPECSSAITSKLHRNLGLLYASKGDYDEALRQFADDIYHASTEFGTDSIRTSGGYFHMANVFFRQSKMDTADSLYKRNRLEVCNSLIVRVTDIWHSHLHQLVKFHTRPAALPSGIGPTPEENEVNEEELDVAQEAEAIQILNAIYDMWDHQPECKPDIKAKVTHALSMLYYLIHDMQNAKVFANGAMVEDVQDEELAKSIREFLDLCTQPLKPSMREGMRVNRNDNPKSQPELY